MNIPEIYLVEPYNAYAPKQNKKHWHQLIEEQALLARLQAEQIALQEAANRTLPPNSPVVSSATVGNPSAGAGAGGVYPPQVFYPSATSVSFSLSPALGDGPLTVQFTNLTTNPELYRYTWIFSDGQTSNAVNPTMVFQSGSSTTSRITASLQATSSTFGTPAGTSSVGYISASKPSVTAGFTFTTSSNVAPYTITLINTTVNTSQTPSTTYLWTFAGGTTTTATSTNPTATVQSGSFTASLQSTGSYGIASKYTQSFFAAPPTLTSAFTLVTSSTAAPSTASFTSTTAYNGTGTITYLWSYGSGSLTSTAASPTPVIYINSGPYTASLQVTESLYGITSFVTRSWRLT